MSDRTRRILAWIVAASGAVLLAYVVPQVVSVYQQSRQTLPWLTQALIAVSRIVVIEMVPFVQ